MNKVKKILAPTDLSELSRAGVRYALEHAASTDTEVIIYHVVGYREAGPYCELDVGYVSERTLAVGELVEEHRRHLAEFLRKNFSELVAKGKAPPGSGGRNSLSQDCRKGGVGKCGHDHHVHPRENRICPRAHRQRG